ncbi:hypothetical protein TNCV_2942291 [Trichonephila clavipes]|nr:hypothetical protein TNCV_2942291 [Trichonephila clavipes]
MTESNSVTVSRTPYGGSINQLVTLTLKIPSKVSLYPNRLTFFFIQIIPGPHLRRNETIETVHRSVLSIDR